MDKTEQERRLLENEYILKAGPHASEYKLKKIRGEDEQDSPSEDEQDIVTNKY